MAFKVIFVLGLLAVVSAGLVPAPQVYHVAPAAVVKTIAPVLTKTSEEYDPHPQYKYSYDVQDSISGDSKSQVEERDGDVVRGEYSLIDADGYKRTVQYTADPVNGFQADVHREPLVKAVPTVVKTVVPEAHYTAPTYVKSVAPVAHYAAPTYVNSVSPVTHYSAPTYVKSVAPVAHYAAPTFVKSVAPVAHYAAPTYVKSLAPVAQYTAPTYVKSVAPVTHYAAPTYVNSVAPVAHYTHAPAQVYTSYSAPATYVTHH